MGTVLTKILNKLNGTKEKRILILGLDATGKTTILNQLCTPNCTNNTSFHAPTIGFNVEQVRYKKIKFTFWDIGGDECIRFLWRRYYSGTNGLVFVVDSQDKQRLDITRMELNLLLDEPELRGVPVLVFANKQDLPGTINAIEMENRLGLSSCREHQYHVQSSIATTGNGLSEGLDWLCDVLDEGLTE
jgi:small GTP-binding protein